MSENDVLQIPGVERPVVAPEYGAKTAQAVLDIIRLHPEMHDQNDWILHRNSCGTTMCIAGWTQFIHEGTVVERPTFNRFGEVVVRDVEDAATEYLDLSEYDAERLFFETNCDEAVAALEYLARAEHIDWVAVYGYDPDTTWDKS